MPGLSLKEAIEVLKTTLKNYKECVGKNADKELQQALSLAISKLQLLLQVEVDGVEKLKKEIAERLECVEIGGDIGLATSQIIDLCHDEFTAWLVGRVEGIIDIFPEFFHTITIKGKNEPDMPHQQVIFKKDVPNVITTIKTMIMGGKEGGV